MNILNLLNGNAFIDSLKDLWQSTGMIAGTNWQNYVMLLISFVLVYLAIVKKFEPLLLLPIAFGMFIVNIPAAYNVLFGTKGYIVTDTLTNQEVARGTLDQLLIWVKSIGGTDITNLAGLKEFIGTIPNYSISAETIVANEGLFYYLYKGVDWVIYPPIIFLGIGAMTDFGPLIARPKSMIIGAAAQVGIFITFVGAYFLFKEHRQQI